MPRKKEELVINKKDEYKLRIVIEYNQLKERYIKLHEMLVKYDAGVLDYSIKGKVRIFRKQAKAMGEYLYCLEVRAKQEGINLTK